MKTLEGEAGTFAADLTDTLNSVFDLKGESPRFLALQAPSTRGHQLVCPFTVSPGRSASTSQAGLHWNLSLTSGADGTITSAIWPLTALRGPSLPWASATRFSGTNSRAEHKQLECPPLTADTVKQMSQPNVSEIVETVTSVRQAAAVCNVTPPVVRRWVFLELIPGPPWTVQQLHQIRDETDPQGRRRRPQVPQGTLTRWLEGCAVKPRTTLRGPVGEPGRRSATYRDAATAPRRDLRRPTVPDGAT